MYDEIQIEEVMDRYITVELFELEEQAQLELIEVA